MTTKRRQTTRRRQQRRQRPRKVAAPTEQTAAPAEGWADAAVLAEVAQPAIDAALAAQADSTMPIDDGLAGQAALQTLRVAIAASAERGSYQPDAIAARWAETARSAGLHDLASQITEHAADMHDLIEIAAAVAGVLYSRLQQRRQAAEQAAQVAARQRAEQQRRPRLDEVEHELQRALGVHYRPPTTPQQREHLIDLAIALRQAGSDPEARAEAIGRYRQAVGGSA